MKCAMARVAAHVRLNKKHSVWSQVRWPSPDEQAERERLIEHQAAEMECAETYEQFETALSELHKLGMFPFLEDVSRVAQIACQLER